MKLITLQGEVGGDRQGYLVTEKMMRPITIKEIQFPQEMTLQKGYTEIKIKVLTYGEVTKANILDSQDVTKEIIGTEKLYLENQVLTLKADHVIPIYGYHLIFQIKNGTGVSRMYTMQVWYE